MKKHHLSLSPTLSLSMVKGADDRLEAEDALPSYSPLRLPKEFFWLSGGIVWALLHQQDLTPINYEVLISLFPINLIDSLNFFWFVQQTLATAIGQPKCVSAQTRSSNIRL